MMTLIKLIRRNYVKILLSPLIIATAIMPTDILASDINQSLPSAWAIQSVNLAIAEEIVPSSITKEYSFPITREEYTTLAYNIYITSGNNITIQNPTPFVDIENSKYTDKLIKAYNAELIHGSSDGFFNPYTPVTREEIATLLVNLMRSINSSIDFSVNENHYFVDRDEISSWALPSVKYLYENSIFKSNLELTFGPKEFVTREEAIVLAYSIMEKLELTNRQPYINNPHNTIYIDRHIDSFQNTFNQEITQSILKIKNNVISDRYLALFNIEPTSVNIYFNIGDIDTTYIKMGIEHVNSSPTEKLVIKGQTMFPTRDAFVDTMNELAEASKYRDIIRQIFATYVQQAQQGYMPPFKQSLGKDSYFEGYTLSTANGNQYFFIIVENPSHIK